MLSPTSSTARAAITGALLAVAVQAWPASIQFTNFTGQAGLVYNGVGYGASWGDANGDGYPDLWVGNHQFEPALMLSTGLGTFTNATATVDHGGDDMHGSAWADFDNDGDQDLLVLKGAEHGAGGVANRLLVNQGGTFVDQALPMTIDYPYGRGRMPTWVDWNLDGRLDAIVVNTNDRIEPPEAPTRVFTFRGDLNRFFEEPFNLHVTSNTLWAQLMFANPATHQPTVLLHTNKADAPDNIWTYGPGGFTNAVAALGKFGFGSVNDSTLGDFDGDLSTDVFTVGYDTAHLLLQRATGFEDHSAAANIGVNRAYYVVSGDFDNDTDLDVYIGRSNNPTQGNYANVLLENTGNGSFQTVPQAAGAEGTQLGFISGLTVVDYNNDGFLDLFVNNGDNWHVKTTPGPSQLFKNLGNGNHWLAINLRGNTSNRDGIGARVLIDAGGKIQLREQNGGIHHRSQDHARLHVGLGSATMADSITIVWPSGITQQLHDVAADQVLTISEAETGSALPPFAPFTFTLLGGRSVLLNASAAFDPDGFVAGYTWDLGDGQTASGAVVVHTFDNDGAYEVELTVTDNSGLTASVTHVVEVSAADQPPPLTVHAVGDQPGSKSNIVDEVAPGAPNLGTSWVNSGTAATAWFTLDLGVSRPVNGVEIAPRGDRIFQLQIAVGDTLSQNKVVGPTVGCTTAGDQPTVPATLTNCPTPGAWGRYVTVRSINQNFFKTHGVRLPPLVVPNVAPALDPIADVTIFEGDDLLIPVFAQDPDGPAPLVLTATSSLPDNPPILTDFGGGAGELAWTAPAGSAGSYTVEVQAIDAKGAQTAVSADIRVLVPGAGILDGTVTTVPLLVDLSAYGAVDWIHWGRLPSQPDRKATGGARISTFTPFGGAWANVSGTMAKYKWSDGAPATITAGTKTGVRMSTMGGGFVFTAPADAAPRTLRVFTTKLKTQARLTATLSDGSATPWHVNLPKVDVKTGDEFIITYRSGAPGQTLTIRWEKLQSSGWISLDAAVLMED